MTCIPGERMKNWGEGEGDVSYGVSQQQLLTKLPVCDVALIETHQR